MNRLDGKVALITGGARGQGAAEAELFIAAGACVVITDILDDEGTATAERLGEACTFMHHDVSSGTDWSSVIDAVADRHGHIDVLVNNAGIFPTGGLEDTSLELWNQTIAINQTGVFLGMQSVTPTMKTNGGGSIVNISSVAGLRSWAGAHAYSASKWAVRGMTKSAAVEFARFGIRVNSVHPGVIATDMLNQFGDGIHEQMAKQIPLGRVADADEVGRLVQFLASDDSGYCTGQEFTIDGGFTS